MKRVVVKIRCISHARTYRVASPLEVSDINLCGGGFGVLGLFGHGDRRVVR